MNAGGSARRLLGRVGHKAQWSKAEIRVVFFPQICVNNCWIFIQSNSFL